MRRAAVSRTTQPNPSPGGRRFLKTLKNPAHGGVFAFLSGLPAGSVMNFAVEMGHHLGGIAGSCHLSRGDGGLDFREMRRAQVKP